MKSENLSVTKNTPKNFTANITGYSEQVYMLETRMIFISYQLSWHDSTAPMEETPAADISNDALHISTHKRCPCIQLAITFILHHQSREKSKITNPFWNTNACCKGLSQKKYHFNSVQVGWACDHFGLCLTQIDPQILTKICEQNDFYIFFPSELDL